MNIKNLKTSRSLLVMATVLIVPMLSILTIACGDTVTSTGTNMGTSRSGGGDDISTTHTMLLESLTSTTFQTTSNTYSETDNWNTSVSNEFGVPYRVVDWNDIVQYHNSGNDLIQSIRSLSNLVTGEADPGVRSSYPTDNPIASFYVTYNGSKNTGTRYYFASLYENQVRGGFAVHDSINLQGYVLALGSWFGLDLPILATSSQAITASPLPLMNILPTTTITGFQTTSNTYSETDNWNTSVSNEFGESYRVVDWNDIIQYQSSGNDLIQSIRSLSNLVTGEADPGVRDRYPTDNPIASFYVTFNGSRNIGSRYYFASLYENEVRDGFLVHDSINLQGYVLALGSWSGLDLPVLAALPEEG